MLHGLTFAVGWHDVSRFMACKLEDLIREEIMVSLVREARRREALQPNRDRDGGLVVEYLEDSKISVEYFKMKNSVFFSMIEKEDKNGTLTLKPDGSKVISEKESNLESKVKFFNVSAVSQDEFVLNSVCVGY